MRHSGTAARRPASPDMPRPRADFAGGGRCWVRTNVGLADGFTDDHGSRLPTYADLLRRNTPDSKIVRRSREYNKACRPIGHAAGTVTGAIGGLGRFQ